MGSVMGPLLPDVVKAVVSAESLSASTCCSSRVLSAAEAAGGGTGAAEEAAAVTLGPPRVPATFGRGSSLDSSSRFTTGAIGAV